MSAVRGLFLLATLLVVAGGAQALTPDEVGRKVAADWGVEVLKVRSLRVDSQDVVAVTVMSPAGSFNGALGVTTLLADAATGQLVPQFRHNVSGYSLPAVQPGPQRDIPGAVIRERATR